VPTMVRMPAIGLRAPVYAAGVTSGRMRLPVDVGDVGWLRRSAAVADAIGTTVIAGHVSVRHDQPGAMYHLGRAHRGQRITITRAGTTSRFRVVATASYPRTQRLPHRYFATGGRHRLVLISCTDRVVYPNGHFHYTRYQVVVADATSRRFRSR
jgi:sortase (surface protein transpeptidase)